MLFKLDKKGESCMPDSANLHIAFQVDNWRCIDHLSKQISKRIPIETKVVNISTKFLQFDFAHVTILIDQSKTRNFEVHHYNHLYENWRHKSNAKK